MGVHISKMSHQHSSGQTTVCQVSPAAARTLNIGTESLSFRKGLEGRGGRWGGSVGRAEPLGQISVIGKSLLKRYSTLAISFESEISLSAKDRKENFLFIKGQFPLSLYSQGPFFKPGKVKCLPLWSPVALSIRIIK